ncbi:MAG: methionyl-tRNA formyltransferase [Actinobacteria bacterium]|nr:methionyl-tRNA formyltransferase [Actinomycetota bacterium]
MRVVIVTRILPVLLGFHAGLTEAGHEPVALLTLADRDGRYGGFQLDLAQVPAGLDVLVPARRSSIAPLLRAVEPDIAVCMGFPWKVPADALAVPPHGWINGHPSLLPRHRGPIPVAWAIRDGDEEMGVTFHRMDAEFDTGPILAQTRFPLELAPPEEFFGRMGQFVGQTLAAAFERLAAGEQGDPQEGGDYQTFFTADDARLDLSRPASEVHRLAWAWRFAMVEPGSGNPRGALLDLDGETVRVLATSLDERDGARRVGCADAPLWIVETEPVEA